MPENTFTNAKIGFLGNVHGVDDVAHDVFKIEAANNVPLYGNYFYVFLNKGHDFDLEIGVFGYTDYNNIPNPHPDARQHFSPNEFIAIEQLIRSFFLSSPEKFARRCPPPLRFSGRIAFRPNWILESRTR